MKLHILIVLSTAAWATAAPSGCRAKPGSPPTSRGACLAKKNPGITDPIPVNGDKASHSLHNVGNGNGNNNGVGNNLLNGNDIDISPDFSPSLNLGGHGHPGPDDSANKDSPSQTDSATKDSTSQAGSTTKDSLANGDHSLQNVGNGNGNNNGVGNNLLNGNDIDISPDFSPSLSLGGHGHPGPDDSANKDSPSQTDSATKNSPSSADSANKGKPSSPEADSTQEQPPKDCPCSANATPKPKLSLDGVGNSNGNENGVGNGIGNGNSINFSPNISPSINL